MDSFDDIFFEESVTNARAGGKFRPKIKPRARKGASTTIPSVPQCDTKGTIVVVASSGLDMVPSVQTVDNPNNVANDSVITPLATSSVHETKSILHQNGDSSSTADVNQSWELSFPDDVRRSASMSAQTGEDLGSTDAVHAEVARLDSKSELCSNPVKSAGEADCSELDVEPSIKLLPQSDTKSPRDGGKFQATAKPCFEKETSVTVSSILATVTHGIETTESVKYVDISDNIMTNPVGLPSAPLEIARNKEPLKHFEVSYSGDNRSFNSVNVSSGLVSEEDNAGSENHLLADVVGSGVTRDYDSSIGKSMGEFESAGFDVNPFDDVHLESGSCDARAGGKFRPKGKPRSKKGTSSLVDSNITSGILPNNEPSKSKDYLCSEIPSKNMDKLNSSLGKSSTENVEIFSGLDSLDNLPTKSTSRMVSGASRSGESIDVEAQLENDSSIFRIDDAAQGYTYPDYCLAQDQITCRETNEKDRVIKDVEIRDIMSEGIITSGTLKPAAAFSSDPSSEVQSNIEQARHTNTPHSVATVNSGDVVHSEDVPVIPTEVIARRKKQKVSSVSDPPENPEKNSRAGDLNGSEKTTRQLRKRSAVQQSVDDHDEEADDDAGLIAEPSGNFIRDEDKAGNTEGTTSKKRAPRKSKKHATESDKGAKKRKKANEPEDHSEPPKKFSHSTRRSKRQVDKNLLAIPEDELDFRNVPIKDLILLAEYKEHLAKKEATRSKRPLSNESAGNASHKEDPPNEVETSDLDEDGGFTENQSSVQADADIYFNYHSYMKKPRSARWSKHDTEMFYKAVRQFGTDFSMIQQLFPDRTRHQVKLKFKKEEREHPLRLSEAVHTRAKDNSHFELVIKRLQEAAQAEQDLNGDDCTDLTGEDEVELAPGTKEDATKFEDSLQQEGVAKSESGLQEKKVNPKINLEEEVVNEEGMMEADEESDDEDFSRWNQYKSEY